MSRCKVLGLLVSRLTSFHSTQGSGDNPVVRAPDSWSKGDELESPREWWVNFLLHGQLLCWLLFGYPFHPCITTVARKRSQSLFQKYKWQVTAKHTCTLCMRLQMKWHCKLVHGCTEFTERVQTAAVSCGTSRVTTEQCCKYSTLVDIQNTLWKAAVTHSKSHATRVQWVCSRNTNYYSFFFFSFLFS